MRDRELERYLTYLGVSVQHLPDAVRVGGGRRVRPAAVTVIVVAVILMALVTASTYAAARQVTTALASASYTASESDFSRDGVDTCAMCRRLDLLWPLLLKCSGALTSDNSRR